MVQGQVFLEGVMKKGHSKNEPENIPYIRKDNLFAKGFQRFKIDF